VKWVSEILAWVAFSAVVGLLSVWPRYEMVDPGAAMVTVTFSHAAQRVGECRQLSQDELNKLPPNMRKPADCPRERHPVRLELRSGDTALFRAVLPPSGIWSDGKANIYRRIVVPSGQHELFVGMNDSGGETTFDYQYSKRLDIAPGSNIVVRFDTELQQFTIR
jgi:hypothetical protein